MSSFILSAFAVLGLISTTTTAAFSAASKNNIATYWGQGAYQQRLLETCKNPAIDIINIGFIDVFPDQGPGGWPGSNFGNACGSQRYQNDGVTTDLYSNCPDIGPDITECQTTYGKKIFLSIGGGGANGASSYILNAASGQNFANFLWSAFGPVAATNGGPRPFGNAVVDGFDFDLENNLTQAPKNDPSYQTSGVPAMITQFRGVLFPQDTSKTYYISGSPQCPTNDPHFQSVISQVMFDFLFIQFYNNPTCSARAAIMKSNGRGTNDISFGSWVQATSKNPNVKMYIGLAAAPAAANPSNPSFYLTPNEVQKLVQRFYGQARFGGIMLWEATYDQNNTICGKDYATYVNQILVAAGQSKTASIPTVCPKTTATPISTLKTVTTTPAKSTSTGSVSPTTRPTTTSSQAPSHTVAAPTQTVSGTSNQCYQWYTVQSGDTCANVETKFDITLAQFRALNTYIDAACDNLFLNYAYCVSGVVQS